MASLFILSQLALGRGDAVLAFFVLVLCVAWVAAIAELRPHYVEMFRRALREGIIEARGGLPDLDLVSLETLFASLNSRDDGEVIAALDLLHAEDRTRLVPALILYHPAPAVVLRALELFERARAELGDEIELLHEGGMVLGLSNAGRRCLELDHLPELLGMDLALRAPLVAFVRQSRRPEELAAVPPGVEHHAVVDQRHGLRGVEVEVGVAEAANVKTREGPTKG